MVVLTENIVEYLKEDDLKKMDILRMKHAKNVAELYNTTRKCMKICDNY